MQYLERGCCRVVVVIVANIIIIIIIMYCPWYLKVYESKYSRKNSIYPD